MISQVFHVHRPRSWTSSHASASRRSIVGTYGAEKTGKNLPVGPEIGPTVKLVRRRSRREGEAGVLVARYLRTGTVEGVMKQVSIVILEALSGQGLIKTSLKQVGLKIREEQGELFVVCANLPAEENNLFIQSLQEFLDPVENPRYLLVRHTTVLKKIKQTDYFAIPSALSPNKKGVELFQKLWNKYIGDGEIVYTRNPEGRRLLLKARKYAFSATQKRLSKRLSKWQ